MCNFSGKISAIFLLPVLLLAGCGAPSPEPVKYVNPFIGVKGGAVYAAAACPWGMITRGPFYAHQKYDSVITGFSHLHFSGTGCGDIWGSIILSLARGKVNTGEDFLKSAYSQEKASAGYYSVYLNKHKVRAQMSATLRTAIHRFTFDADSQFILIDLSRHLNSKFDSSYINIVSPSEIEGYVSEGSFCSSSPDIDNIYFVVRFNKPSSAKGVWDEKSIYPDKVCLKDKNIGAFLTYNLPVGDSIEAYVAISYVSIANARLNLETEQKDMNFEKIMNKAYAAWNAKLSRVLVEGKCEADKTVFYTGLYHMLLHPKVFNDVNGEYRSEGSIWRTGKQHKILNSGKRTRYTDFSLWDAFRTVHPFLNSCISGNSI